MMRDIPRHTTRCLGLWVSLCLLAGGVVPPALAQFNSGSTGTNGAFPPVATPVGTTEIQLNLANGMATFLPGGTTAILPGTPGGGFANGVLHFTTVDVPTGVTWRFPSAVVPLSILATGNVNVDGTIDLSGDNGSAPGVSIGGKGGPGGFKGGQGLLTPGSRAGAGLGPGGGGAGGVLAGSNQRAGSGGGFGLDGGVDGSLAIVGGSPYGIPALLPLIGGSGGGGGCRRVGGDPSGPGGGGGGGAILIASSTTLSVTGAIYANGGNGGSEGGGGGSGGAIRLMASTLTGSGQLLANGGAGGSNTVGRCFGGGGGGAGRIRLEAFTNDFTGTTSGNTSGGVPGIVFLPNMLAVRIDSVGGTMVPPFPIGAAGGVDVVIPAPGTVSIVLRASRVPLGTTVAVTAKPETDADVIGPVISPALTGILDDSTASVDVIFPNAGVFFLEARATFMVP